MPKRKTADSCYQNLVKDIDLNALKKTLRSFSLNFPTPEVDVSIQLGILF